MHKKLILKITMAVIGVTSAAIFIPWLLFWAWIKPLPDTVQEQVNDAINLGLDGIIVYIDESGKAPAFYAAGWKDRDSRVPADPEAFFKIASISKLYIAAATVKLVHSEDLSLDDTLAELLPDHAGRIENADRITLRMLLQHRSGIPDWIDDSEFPWTRSVTDVGQVLEFVLDDPAEFKPDARYDYSNTNYLLIGNILDKTLGYSHQQYIYE
jgi:D-alanyl-D-alanine carboxypeptidase